MENSELIRVRDMLDSALAILTFLERRRRSSLDSDRMLASAVFREFEIIGEAAGKISEAPLASTHWDAEPSGSCLF